jgi:hypothetical protein
MELRCECASVASGLLLFDAGSREKTSKGPLTSSWPASGDGTRHHQTASLNMPVKQATEAIRVEIGPGFV